MITTKQMRINEVGFRGDQRNMNLRDQIGKIVWLDLNVYSDWVYEDCDYDCWSVANITNHNSQNHDRRHERNAQNYSVARFGAAELRRQAYANLGHRLEWEEFVARVTTFQPYRGN